MRQHGNANVNARWPRAFAVCDRCGFLYNHDDLQWQHQWVATKLQNIRLLVCQTCLDKPQEQLRTIVLPPDPMPIENARPENYVDADNPLSALGYSPNQRFPQYSNQIGTLTGGGGVAAAFNGSLNKPAWMCANNTISQSSFENYVGINWTGNNGMASITPSSVGAPTVVHSLTSFTAYAPNDRSFLGLVPTPYVVQSSPIYPAPYAAWTTISSGTTAGTIGETISGACNGSEQQYHRLAFQGDGVNFVSVAGLEFNVAQIESAVSS